MAAAGGTHTLLLGPDPLPPVPGRTWLEQVRALKGLEWFRINDVVLSAAFPDPLLRDQPAAAGHVRQGLDTPCEVAHYQELGLGVVFVVLRVIALGRQLQPPAQPPHLLAQIVLWDSPGCAGQEGRGGGECQCTKALA